MPLLRTPLLPIRFLLPRVYGGQAHSLARGIYLLCTHPNEQAHVCDEVSTGLPPVPPPLPAAGDSGASPRTAPACRGNVPPVVPPPPRPALSSSSITALPYLHELWNETLRLYPPPASGVSRCLTADVVLPAGTSIKMPPPHGVSVAHPKSPPTQRS